MSYCEIKKYQSDSESEKNAIKIFYKTHGNGATKLLLIIGLAGTHESWGPQIKAFTGDMEVCCFDNRGMGRSSVPTKKTDYTTSIMARDAIALMDHLGWTKAHVVGHSMGAMISCKLAAMVPHRILSLALLNVTGGGFQCFPKIDRKMIALAIRFLKAKTPEQRAAVDLDTHYTKEYLDEYVGVHTRRTILYQEYVKGISSSGMQSNFGFEGQISACWTHKLTSKEIQVIRSGGFLISVIHGRHDIIAQMIHAKKLAENLQPFAKMVDLHGAHLVSHERPQEVNEALLGLIEASKQNVRPEEWSNLGEIGVEILSGGGNGKKENRLTLFMKKVHLFILYVLGVFVMAFEQGRKMLTRQKLVRVSATAS